MRIISGSLGGRIVKTVPGEGMRPAMQRTREALFSMLEAAGVGWGGLRVLDLFAGSGSLAFECVSRGADFAELVENSRKVAENIGANIATLDIMAKCHVSVMDVLKYLRRGPLLPYGLVFIDPPYRQKLIQPALNSLCARNWLAAGAYVVAELERGDVAKNPPGLQKMEERLFGQTCLHIWRNDSEDGNEAIEAEGGKN